MSHSELPIAVVGAGFTGTITALHLIERVRAPSVLLCERAASFARGMAYSTDEPVHLLNVRAANMSAFPDHPDHFVDWLKKSHPASAPGIHENSAGTFVSRELYGRYLTSLIRNTLKRGEGALRLRIVPDEVIDLQPVEEGFRLVLAGGREHRVAGAVLAVGNLLPANRDSHLVVDNPWSVPFEEGLVPGEPVVIVGSGLTMVDIAMRLWRSGFPGPVTALSRRGLLPHMHGPTTSWPTPGLSTGEQQSLLRLSRRVRREILAARQKGIEWQSVIDSLRPITSQLWRALPEDEQKRFLRHLRPWWDVHRHRMAPSIGHEVVRLVRTGFLSIQAARIISIETGDRRATITYKPRREDKLLKLDVQKVIDATGLRPLASARDNFLQKIIERGIARLDRHRLGIDVTERFEVVGRSGEATKALWALGPIVRGVFGESTAVPDIRLHAKALAAEVETAIGV